jgi:hypothetical protein
MDSNPLQRALDNYLVMEMQCEVAKREAMDTRVQNAKLVAEVEMLRERLADVEADRRKWQVSCSTLLGRLLSINETIAGAVRQASKDGLEARDTPEAEKEPREAEGVAAAAAQCAGTDEHDNTPADEKASPTPPQRILAAVPRNEFRR